MANVAGIGMSLVLVLALACAAAAANLQWAHDLSNRRFTPQDALIRPATATSIIKK
jgi:hypothetical protein